MKKAGLLISDVKLQFELMEALRVENIPFEVIIPEKKVPREIGVVLTTSEDRSKITFRRVIICSLDNIASVVRKTKASIASRGKIKSLIIGIDPGRAPGIAVMADQTLVDSTVVASPEAVADQIREFLQVYPSEEVLVRIGHGDKTKRNRIFNSIWDMGISLEIVDERNTSTTSEQKDIDAAIEIALTPGYSPKRKQLIEPSAGEITDTQRISRISSNGEITISRSLATSVAKGEISMDEAIERQKSSRKKNSGNDQASKRT